MPLCGAKTKTQDGRPCRVNKEIDTPRKEFVVYKITNINSNKIYIGVTSDYKRRMNDHFIYCRQEGSYLHSAVLKHGKNNFQSEIIYSYDSWERACQKEIECIKLFKTKVPGGYNLTDGGEGALGVFVSEKTRGKLSENWKGRKHTKESKRKVSEAKKGHIVSKETRIKIGNANRGKVHSEESKELMSIASKGRFFSDIARQNMSEAASHKSKETRRKIAKAFEKFSDKQILEIRKLLSKGVYQYVIAKKFNVHKVTISRIKWGKTYAHIL